MAMGWGSAFSEPQTKKEHRKDWMQTAFGAAPQGTDQQDPILRKLMRKYYKSGGDAAGAFYGGLDQFRLNMPPELVSKPSPRPELTITPPTQVIQQGPDPAAMAAVAAMRAQADQLAAQQEADRHAQMQALKAQINDIISERTLGVNQLRGQRDQVGIDEEFQRGESQRQQVFDMADMRENVAGRGLSRSGVRLGAENRGEDALVRALAGISTQASQQRDAISGDISDLRTRARTQVGGLEGQLRGLKKRGK